MGNKYYAAIDLKSFYASVECFARNLDPLNANLVVADESRTEKTICLAVSPTLKKYGIPGRARLFEVIQKVKEINKARAWKAPGHKLIGKSFLDNELEADKSLELDFVIAVPRMGEYIRVSSEIYSVYLKYVSPEDIHVYSIDEVFIDLTPYLNTYKMTPKELTSRMINDVLKTTGITATGGIGTNLYLAKVAMDVVAKHIDEDENGVRIAELDEMSYRRLLWEHKPLTSFWRVGPGISKKLMGNGMYTMGDVAKRSIENEDSLYKLFGINAELLIDHAWGYEPTTIRDIKNYRSMNNSLSQGQVLSCAYTADKAKLVVREMTDVLVLEMVEKKVTTDAVVLNICYDKDSLLGDVQYKGELQYDRYGKVVPKDSHGTKRLGRHTSSTKLIMDAMMKLYDEIVNPSLLVRRIYVIAINVIDEDKVVDESFEQLDLFSNIDENIQQKEELEEDLKEEKELQKTLIEIQKRYGKNAVVKGSDLSEGATKIDRNQQIGGHKK
ncbi:MAG: DNA methylase [Bacilli bacterium]|nr:DNA methylase [Bacilli bacterium]